MSLGAFSTPSSTAEASLSLIAVGTSPSVDGIRLWCAQAIKVVSKMLRRVVVARRGVFGMGTFRNIGSSRKGLPDLTVTGLEATYFAPTHWR